jgi:hypothetical protein
MPSPNYPPPLGTAVPNTPGAPNPPQSPSGALSADAPPPQFDTGEMITQQFLAGIGENIPPQGTPSLTAPVQLAGVAHVQQNAWEASCTDNIR